MTELPCDDEILIEAKNVADGYDRMYGTRRSWWDWGCGAREDFWSIALDQLGIAEADRKPAPEWIFESGPKSD